MGTARARARSISPGLRAARRGFAPRGGGAFPTSTSVGICASPSATTRYLAKKLKRQSSNNPDAGHLRPTTMGRVALKRDRLQAMRRKYFVELA